MFIPVNTYYVTMLEKSSLLAYKRLEPQHLGSAIIYLVHPLSKAWKAREGWLSQRKRHRAGDQRDGQPKELHNYAGQLMND